MMKVFNITAQVYESNDPTKQTLLFNKEVYSNSENDAKSKFENYHLVPQYKLLKIYSIEEICEVVS